MALELGTHCLLLESILGPDGCILFLKYRHFPFWIPHLIGYQPLILNIPAELRPHFLNYFCPALSYFAYLLSAHRIDNFIEDLTTSVLDLCVKIGKLDVWLCECVPAHVYWYQMWIVDALVIIAGSSDLM
jgi:hypothetical protein